MSDVYLDVEHYTIPSNEMPPLPKKPLVISILLFLAGSSLIIIGCIEELVDIDPSRGIAFWVLGGLLFIPGAYYSYKFYRAYKAKTANERLRYLREIPDFD